MEFTNYKAFFDHKFSDPSKFQIEEHLEGAIQRDSIKYLPESLRIEILYVFDNGAYEQLFDIRIKHPQFPGYAKWQNQQEFGNIDKYPRFSAEHAVQILNDLKERLRLGWTEALYFKNQVHYKSRIDLPVSLLPSVVVWRKDPKPFWYLLMSTFFSKLYYLIDSKTEVKVRSFAGVEIGTSLK